MNVGILLAAGRNERFGGDEKLFCNLKGKPVIFHSLKFLEDSKFIDQIFIVANKLNRTRIEKLAKNAKFRKVKKVLIGGKIRYGSVFNAINNIPAEADFLVIHNAANPLATQSELSACFKNIKKGVSGIAVGHTVSATVKMLKNKEEGAVDHTIPRTNLREMETPQVVRAQEFIVACNKFPPPKFDYTDDLSVLEAAKKCTLVVGASILNKKITTRQDLEILRFLSGDFGPVNVGIGEDSHRFMQEVNAPKLVLGGVKIKKLPQLKADSDGDVVIHALCNAISSALGGGSLGTYATKMCKAGIIDSKKYLQKILDKMKAEGKKIYNCAISIEAAIPQIDPLVSAMKKSLGKLLQVSKDRIGIAATSGKKLTPFGRGEGIKCQAVISLTSHDA